MIRSIKSLLRRFRKRNYLDEDDLRQLHKDGDAAMLRLKKRIEEKGPSNAHSR